jgi:SHAQKYF class myb-like DNA-binding protein
MYNTSGYTICGVLNQHNKPCQRIGKCPFHHKEDGSPIVQPKTENEEKKTFEFIPPTKKPVSIPTTIFMPKTVLSKNTSTEMLSPRPIMRQNVEIKPNTLLSTTTVPPHHHQHTNQKNNHKVEQEEEEQEEEDQTPLLGGDLKKKPFKHGWTKEEHLKFLTGLEVHGKGQWKQISTLVGTRSPTQIQSHAQKYFLRQRQQVKNKRSIHDLTIEDLKDCFNGQEKKQKIK